GVDPRRPDGDGDGRDGRAFRADVLQLSDADGNVQVRRLRCARQGGAIGLMGPMGPINTHPNHTGISPAGGKFTTLRLLICGCPRTSFRASSGGGLSRFSTAMASPPGNWRPTVICAMLTACLPKIVPMKPISPGTSRCVKISMTPSMNESR